MNTLHWHYTCTTLALHSTANIPHYPPLPAYKRRSVFSCSHPNRVQRHESTSIPHKKKHPFIAQALSLLSCMCLVADDSKTSFGEKQATYTPRDQSSLLFPASFHPERCTHLNWGSQQTRACKHTISQVKCLQLPAHRGAHQKIQASPIFCARRQDRHKTRDPVPSAQDPTARLDFLCLRSSSKSHESPAELGN